MHTSYQAQSQRLQIPAPWVPFPTIMLLHPKAGLSQKPSFSIRLPRTWPVRLQTVRLKTQQEHFIETGPAQKMQNPMSTSHTTLATYNGVESQSFQINLITLSKTFKSPRRYLRDPWDRSQGNSLPPSPVETDLYLPWLLTLSQEELEVEVEDHHRLLQPNPPRSGHV